MSSDQSETTDCKDEDEPHDDFEGHREMDVTVTSNLADRATIDVNGTELLIKQSNKYVPVISEIFVEDETKPIGAINTANGETSTLGGVREQLAKQVDAIKDMPVEEIPDALDELAYRLNPAGREEPESEPTLNIPEEYE